MLSPSPRAPYTPGARIGPRESLVSGSEPAAPAPVSVQTLVDAVLASILCGIAAFLRADRVLRPQRFALLESRFVGSLAACETRGLFVGIGERQEHYSHGQQPRRGHRVPPSAGGEGAARSTRRVLRASSSREVRRSIECVPPLPHIP